MSWCSCAQGGPHFVVSEASQIENHANNVVISQPKTKKSHDKDTVVSSSHRRRFGAIDECIGHEIVLMAALER